MGHQRAIKKALMRGKGYPVKDTQFISSGGHVIGTRDVSTVGWYKLVALVTGRRGK